MRRSRRGTGLASNLRSREVNNIVSEQNKFSTGYNFIKLLCSWRERCLLRPTRMHPRIPNIHHVFVALESAKRNSENAPNAHIAVSIKCMLKCGRHFYVSGAGCY